MLYHRGWLNAVEIARSGMQASLLVIHPETEVGFVLINALLSSYFEVFINVLFYIFFMIHQKLFVNFDPRILELIRECRCMRRLGLEVSKERAISRVVRYLFASVSVSL